MTVYKLTNENMQTYGDTQWVLGEWRETDGRGDLCGPGWLHCYRHPLLAVLFNPIGAYFKKPRLFEAEAEGEVKETIDKLGVTRLRLVREMALPEVTTAQAIHWSILCSLEVPQAETYVAWAQKWLSGEDRSAEAAEAAEAAAAARAAAEAEAAAAARVAARVACKQRMYDKFVLLLGG